MIVVVDASVLVSEARSGIAGELMPASGGTRNTRHARPRNAQVSWNRPTTEVSGSQFPQCFGSADAFQFG